MDGGGVGQIPPGRSPVGHRRPWKYLRPRDPFCGPSAMASVLASSRLRSLPAVNSPTTSATFTTIQNPIITPMADIGVSSLGIHDRWGTGRVPAESATLLGFLTPGFVAAGDAKYRVRPVDNPEKPPFLPSVPPLRGFAPQPGGSSYAPGFLHLDAMSGREVLESAAAPLRFAPALACHLPKTIRDHAVAKRS